MGAAMSCAERLARAAIVAIIAPPLMIGLALASMRGGVFVGEVSP